MKHITSAAVFCASGEPADKALLDAASATGALLARKGVALVYGGGALGLMGAAASACAAAGGKVTGVLPEIFDKPHVRRGESEMELVVTPDMHSRKKVMYEKADCFIVLPGGIGTMDEFFEAWTWSQIGYHRKNVGLLNTGGYYDHLLAFLETMAGQGFIRRAVLDDLRVSSDPGELLAMLDTPPATYAPKNTEGR